MMKAIIALMTFLTLFNAQANHCSRDGFLPEAFKAKAIEALEKRCPITMAQEAPLNIVDVKFSSWDTEEYYEIHFQGRGYGTGDVDYDIIVEVEGECRGPQDLSIGTFKVIEGCR